MKSIYNIPQVRSVSTTGVAPLGSLTDVQLSGTTDDQALVFDSGLGKWTNQNIVNSYNSRTGVIISQNSDIENLQSSYYKSFITGSVTPITAVKNTVYKMDNGGSITINPLAVGDHIMIIAAANIINVSFTGFSFVINNNTPGTLNPAIVLRNACIELLCVFNSGQTYYEMTRAKQNTINASTSIITVAGQKQSALSGLNDIPNVVLTSPANNEILRFNGTNWVNSALSLGTVTSVAMTVPSEFTVSGSPITTSGTLAITKASQNQNLIYASPDGSSGQTTFRSLVSADIPALNYLTSFNSRTGAISPASGDYNIGQITNASVLANSANVSISGPVNGQILTYNAGVWSNVAAPAAPVLSVFGRSGAVTAVSGDYNLSQIGTVSLSGPADRQIFKFNGTNWVNRGNLSFYESVVQLFNQTVTGIPGRIYYANNSNIDLPAAASVALGDTIKVFHYGGTVNINFVTNTSLWQQGSSRPSGDVLSTSDGGCIILEVINITGPVAFYRCWFSGTWSANFQTKKMSTDNIGIIDASDTNITSPITGQYLTYSGSAWTNTTLAPTVRMIFYNSNGNLSDNQYMMPGNSMNANINRAEILMTRTGTITQFFARLTVAPGLGNSRTFTVYKNGLATGMSFSILGTDTTGASSFSSVPFSLNDRITVFCQRSGAANSEAIITMEQI